jgi:hypothetical protein
VMVSAQQIFIAKIEQQCYIFRGCGLRVRTLGEEYI